MKGLADIKRKAGSKFMMEVSEPELACRMLEAAQGIKRPAGSTAVQALAHLDPESREWLQRQGEAAMAYFNECLNAGRSVQ